MACKSISFNTGLGASAGSLCVTPKTTDIDVSITAQKAFAGNPGITNRYWIMQLRRKQSDGSWKTVGERTGYVSSSSASHRTFTNVGGAGSTMQVYVRFWFDSAKTDYDTMQIVSFTR